MSTQSVLSAESTPSALRSRLAIVVLGIATFTIVVTEFAPVGLLTLISDDLHQSPSTVGLLVTVYAAIGAVSALGSAVMPSRFPRKPLLLVLMLILVASNAAVLASNWRRTDVTLTASPASYHRRHACNRTEDSVAFCYLGYPPADTRLI